MKSIKRLFNLIAFCFLTVSVALGGCKAAPLSQSHVEPEIKEEITLPEYPSKEPEIPDAEPEIPEEDQEEEIKPPVIQLPESTNPPAKAEGVANQSEVYAKFEYTPIDEEHCSVSCTNKDVATYADIPLQAVVDDKVYYVHEIAERGFENCPRLKTVKIGLNIRKIRDYAFFNCNILENVLINEILGIVTEIGYDAFAHNYNLKEINLSDVRKIDGVAFINCKSLTSVYAPKLTEIGEQAFCGCDNLESVYIPNAKNIETCAFGSCPKLSEIVIPRSAEVFGSGIFYNNSTQVKIARGVNKQNWDRNWNDRNSVTEVIENWVVQAELKFTPINDTECNVKCTNTEAVMHAEIPSTAIIDGKEYTVTEIADSGFSHCTVLESFVLPESVKVIGKYAFAYCTLLSVINLSDLTLINDYAFSSCDNLTDVVIDNVTQIGRAFYTRTNLKSVKISNVTKINNSAFYRCQALTSIDLINVNEVGDHAFRSCTGLTEINLDNVNEIGTSAFFGCTGLSKVNLTDVKAIGYGVFQNCTGLSDIIIPESVITMGKNVFNNCNTQIKAVAHSAPEGWDADWNKGNQNQNVIRGWFEGKAVFGYTAIDGTENCSVSCLNKDEVTFAEIPSTAIIDGKEYTVTEIADNGFDRCENLEKVIVPDSVSTIGKRSFILCNRLTDISFAGVTQICEHAFAGCNSLVNINLSEVENIEKGAFMLCMGVTFVDLSCVTKLGSNVFTRCENLERVCIPRITEIGFNAFFRCIKLNDIIIPESVITMGNNVFNKCNTQIKAVAHSAPESWRESWNDGNANQNIIWGWFEGKAVFGYTPVEGTENCLVSCLNNDEVTYAEIPSTAIIDGKEYTVTGLAENCFYNCSHLRTVILSAGITAIGNSAFAGCSDFKEIVIPETVRTAGGRVFDGCNTQIYAVAEQKPEGWATNWNDGNQNENVKWGWKDEAGRYNYRIISESECEVSLINRVTAVEAYIPATVMIDGKEYFVTSVADNGFQGCVHLKKVVVPYTLKYIGVRAFADCSELENFSIYNTQTIGAEAFANCPELERLFIPKSVKFVGKNILYGNNTAVFIRASSDRGWATNWNDGNAGATEFDSKYFLPVEIPVSTEEY